MAPKKRRTPNTPKREPCISNTSQELADLGTDLQINAMERDHPLLSHVLEKAQRRLPAACRLLHAQTHLRACYLNRKSGQSPCMLTTGNISMFQTRLWRPDEGALISCFAGWQLTEGLALHLVSLCTGLLLACTVGACASSKASSAKHSRPKAIPTEPRTVWFRKVCCG